MDIENNIDDENLINDLLENPEVVGFEGIFFIL